LNPVRAGICEDPADYRWSSYGEAVGGGKGEAKARVVTRKGMSKGKGEAELERLRADEARDLKISKVVRCRVRYFTEGAVIGSKAFVNEVFSASRERFGPKRKDGARKPRGALQDLAGEIWSLRDLQRG
jgi:putative transposase